MKNLIALGLSVLLLLAACSRSSVLKIVEQGSFAVGGTVLTDSLGRTYHGDHAYVFYQKPVDAQKYPLVFAHGVGQSSILNYGNMQPTKATHSNLMQSDFSFLYL